MEKCKKTVSKNNKLKTIAPTRNDEFELPKGPYSVSDIQDYFEHIIKKHETFVHAYINRINNRLVFKLKDGYKIELQKPESMKLIGSTKKLIHKS